MLPVQELTKGELIKGDASCDANLYLRQPRGNWTKSAVSISSPTAAGRGVPKPDFPSLVSSFNPLSPAHCPTLRTPLRRPPQIISALHTQPLPPPLHLLKNRNHPPPPQQISQPLPIAIQIPHEH